MISEYINFSVKNNTGIIKLNRPKALNAINFDMVVLFTETLLKWRDDPLIRQVLLLGEGNSLCAGGDVKSLYLSSNVRENNQVKKGGIVGTVEWLTQRFI